MARNRRSSPITTHSSSDQAALVGSTETGRPRRDMELPLAQPGPYLREGTTRAPAPPATADDVPIYTRDANVGHLSAGSGLSNADLWDGSIAHSQSTSAMARRLELKVGLKNKHGRERKATEQSRPVGGDGSYLGAGAIAGGGDGTARIYHPSKRWVHRWKLDRGPKRSRRTRPMVAGPTRSISWLCPT